MKPQVFKTRRDVERYFSGNTIECLICGRHFKRLHRHLAAKHNLSADHYKKQFGLAWTRGLTSATSLAKSGWTEERKAKARKLARKSRFYELAHLTPRREFAPFLKAEAIEHLGANAKAFGKKFDLQVHALEGLAFGPSPEYSRFHTPPYSNAASGGTKGSPIGEEPSLGVKTASTLTVLLRARPARVRCRC